MAPCTRQQKRLGVRVTRAKAKTKEYRFSLSSSSSSSLSNSSKHRRRATTNKKQSPPPPSTNEESKDMVADKYNGDRDAYYASLREKHKRRERGPSFSYYYPPMPKELLIKYLAEVEASDGFDVDYRSYCDYAYTGIILPVKYEPGGYEPGSGGVECDKDLAKYAKRALTYFKRENQDAKKLEFDRVVKATERPGVIWWYFITFEATDGGNQIKKTLQAHVSVDFSLKNGIKIKFCRLKPPTPTLTSLLPPPPRPKAYREGYIIKIM